MFTFEQSTQLHDGLFLQLGRLSKLLARDFLDFRARRTEFELQGEVAQLYGGHLVHVGKHRGCKKKKNQFVITYVYFKF